MSSRQDIAAGRPKKKKTTLPTTLEPTTTTKKYAALRHDHAFSPCCVFWMICDGAVALSLAVWGYNRSPNCHQFYSVHPSIQAEDLELILRGVYDIHLPFTTKDGCQCILPHEPVYVAPIDMCDANVFEQKTDRSFCQKYGLRQEAKDHLLACISPTNKQQLWNSSHCHDEDGPFLHNGRLVCWRDDDIWRNVLPLRQDTDAPQALWGSKIAMASYATTKRDHTNPKYHCSNENNGKYYFLWVRD